MKISVIVNDMAKINIDSALIAEQMNCGGLEQIKKAVISMQTDCIW
jgi:G3E family GTPase